MSDGRKHQTNNVYLSFPLTLLASHFVDAACSLASTDVKEFVHGDLGRTLPAVSTLLGCKTDILELDCEGIQLD